MMSDLNLDLPEQKDNRDIQDSACRRVSASCDGWPDIPDLIRDHKLGFKSVCWQIGIQAIQSQEFRLHHVIDVLMVDYNYLFVLEGY